MKIPFRVIVVSDFSRLLKRKFNSDSVLSDEDLNLIKRWVEKLFQNNIKCIQIRENDLSLEEIKKILNTISLLKKKYKSFILLNHIVNELLAVDGFHLKENDVTRNKISHYEKIILGKSCHSLQSAKEAEKNNFDYLIFSPVFDTASDGEKKGVGLEKLEEICCAVKIPVFALGGINAKNYKFCLDAGAYGVAGISIFLSDEFKFLNV